MMHPRIAGAFLAVAVAALPALAQEPGPAQPTTAGPSSDYRWALYTSCTVVFAAITVYLVITRNRAAAVADDVAAIERRLDDLERSSASK